MCIHAHFFHLFIKFLINRGQDEEYGHLKHFEFSYAEWHQGNCRPVAAKNWREWKAELRQLENSFVTESPVAHLWQGVVTPLVQPKDATSTGWDMGTHYLYI